MADAVEIGGPGGLGGAKRLRRAPELELWTNRTLVHPLSWRIAVILANTRVSPNMVSAMGAASAAAAGACYAFLPWPFAALAGLVFHVGWHVFDGADGDLARLTGRSSPSGEVVDGICDYLAHLFIYVALAWVLSKSLGGWAWALATATGVSHAVQANHYETARRSYQRWVYKTPWLRQALPTQGATHPGLWPRLQTGLAQGYLAVSAMVSAGDGRVERAMERLAAEPAKADAAVALYRQHHLPLIRRGFPLSANHETLAIFLSMLAGSPLYYFVYGLTLVNLWLFASIASQARRNRRLGEALGRLEALPQT